MIASAIIKRFPVRVLSHEIKMMWVFILVRAKIHKEREIQSIPHIILSLTHTQTHINSYRMEKTNVFEAYIIAHMSLLSQ